MIGWLGYAVVIPMVAGAAIGSFIDQALATGPTATLIFLVLGLAVSVVSLYNAVKDIIHG